MIKVNEQVIQKFRQKGLGKKYRKKPIVIEAFEMEDDFIVDTLEGKMKGEKGDFLIVGAFKEFYPCDKLVFHETYDKVTEGE